MIPADLAAAQGMARTAAASAAERLGLAQRRLHEARRLQQAEQQVLRLEAEADQLGAAAEEDAQTAEEHAAARDSAAVALAEAWRAWCRDPQTAQLLGQTGWAAHPLLGPLIRDATVLAGDDGPALDGLDEVADAAARPARAAVAAERAGLDRAAADDREREAALPGRTSGPGGRAGPEAGRAALAGRRTRRRAAVALRRLRRPAGRRAAGRAGRGAAGRRAAQRGHPAGRDACWPPTANC